MIRLEPAERPHTFGGSHRATVRALDNLRTANRYFGGIRSILGQLGARLDAAAGAVVRVLDLGCGHGDIARALAVRAHQAGARLQVVALDADRAVVDLARKACKSWPEIQVVCGDARALPFGDKTFDYVIASMLLHYFASAEAERLLAAWRRLAASAVVVSEVERHWLPYVALRVLGRVSSSALFDEGHRYTVRRGFTVAELALLGARAGFADVRIRRHVPYRLSLVGLCEGKR